jgi:hypothetical protein
MKPIKWIACAVAALTIVAPVPIVAKSSGPQYLPTCSGYPPQSKPAIILLACGDGAAGIKNLKWTHWGEKEAFGRGTAWQRVCVPNCAQGRDQLFAASVTAFGEQTCPHGELSYLGIKYTLIKPGKTETDSQEFPCKP